MAFISGVNLIRLDTSHTRAVMDHIEDNFYHHDPLLVNTNYLNHEKYIAQFNTFLPPVELLQMMVSSLSNGLCYGYVTPDGIIVALITNEIVSETDPEVDVVAGLKNHQSMAVVQFFKDQHRGINFFQRYRTNRVFDVRIVSVAASHRKKGFARSLLQMSTHFAQQAGVKVMRTDLTSEASRQLFHSEGWNALVSQPYTDYRNEYGQSLSWTDGLNTTYELAYKILP